MQIILRWLCSLQWTAMSTQLEWRFPIKRWLKKLLFDFGILNNLIFKFTSCFVEAVESSKKRQLTLLRPRDSFIGNWLNENESCEVVLRSRISPAAARPPSKPFWAIIISPFCLLKSYFSFAKYFCRHSVNIWAAKRRLESIRSVFFFLVVLFQCIFRACRKFLTLTEKCFGSNWYAIAFDDQAVSDINNQLICLSSSRARAKPRKNRETRLSKSHPNHDKWFFSVWIGELCGHCAIDDLLKMTHKNFNFYSRSFRGDNLNYAYKLCLHWRGSHGKST